MHLRTFRPDRHAVRTAGFLAASLCLLAPAPASAGSTPTRTATPAPRTPTRTATPAPPTRTVTPAPAPTPKLVVNVEALVSLDLTLSHSETGENVHVFGDLIVKTVIKRRKAPHKIKMTYKLAKNVVARGVTTNQLYTIEGHDTVKYSVRPASISRIFQVAVLALHPPDATSPTDRVHYGEVQYQLIFGPDGEISSTQANALPPPESGTCTPLAQFCND